MSGIDAVSRHKVGLRAQSIGFGRWSKGHNKYDNGSVLLFMGPVGDGLLYLYAALTHNTSISVFDTFFKSLFNSLQPYNPSHTFTIADLPGFIPEIQL